MPVKKGARSSRMLGDALKTDVDTVNASKEKANTEKSSTVNVEVGKSVNMEVGKSVNANIVSLTIKVPKSYRQHWQIEAKKQDTTVTKLIIEYLGESLGLPEKG